MLVSLIQEVVIFIFLEKFCVAESLLKQYHNCIHSLKERLGSNEIEIGSKTFRGDASTK